MMTLTLNSPAFENGEEIPRLYTCEGRDLSPPLEWIGVPEGTKSLALIADDPDAPDPSNPKTTWVHWVLSNLPPDLSGLPAGITRPPFGSVAGKNGWNRNEYGGPCPPIGMHRYFFKLYALDCLLEPVQTTTKESVEKAMRGHILAKAEIVGTYRKAGR